MFINKVKKRLVYGHLFPNLPIGKRVQRILIMQVLVLLTAFLMLFIAYTDNVRQQQNSSFMLLNQTVLSNTRHIIKTLETTSRFPIVRSTFQDELFIVLRSKRKTSREKVQFARLFENRTKEIFLESSILDSIFLYNVAGGIEAFKVNNLLYNPIKNATGLDWMDKIIQAKGQLVLLEPSFIRDIGYKPTVHTLFAGRLLADPHTLKPLCIVIVGVRTADITVDFNIQKLKSNQGFSVLLADGSELIGNQPFPIGETLELTPASKNVQDIHWEGMSYRCHLTYDKETGIYCVITTPRKQLFPFPLHSQMILLTFFLLIILVNLLFVTLILRDITRPLEKLVAACKRLGSGDFSTRVEFDASDELNVVIQSFNQMSGHIEKLIDEVYLKNLAERDLELQMLRAQINPHFLYNTLESIRMASYARGEPILAEMNRLLANILRYGITSQNNLVSVQEELNHCKDYSDLLKYRFGNQIQVLYHIDTSIYQNRIIKQLFQPLIENSVNHALAGDGSILSIHIWGYREEDILVFTVSDDGMGLSQEKLLDLSDYINNKNEKFTSIGLKNIQRRIQLYYGQQWGLSIESRPNLGTSVTIRLPLNEANTEEEEIPNQALQHTLGR